MRTKEDNKTMSLNNKWNSLPYYWKRKLVLSIKKDATGQLDTWFWRFKNDPITYKTSDDALKQKIDTFLKRIRDRKAKKSKSD